MGKTNPPPKKRRSRADAAAVLALVVLSSLPFLPTLRFGLVWDDPLLLAEVGRVAGHGGVPALFANDFRLHSDRPLGYYRPATTTSLWMQERDAWRAHGADALPGTARSLHAFNLLVHIVCTLLVWLLIRNVAGEGVLAGLGAALFAVHPAHVEPVAFISARTDLLAAVFVLGSLVCWTTMLRATQGRRVVAVVAGSLLALAASLAKEQALLLPVVLIAWAFLLPEQSAQTRRTRLAWSMGWLAAAALALVMRARVLGALAEPSLTPEPASLVRDGLPALLLYLKLWVLPWPLNGYYTNYDLTVRLPAVVGCATIVFLAVVAVRARRSRETAAASCLALVFLLPVLHLLPLGGAVAAERFFYLPSAGLALLTSLALTAFERGRVSRTTSRAVVCAAVIIFLVLSARGARPWASDAALYARMVEVSPRAPTAHRGLAEVYERAEKYPEAARECRVAIQLDPGFTDAYELLGVVSAKQADNATARQAFEAALRLAPNRASISANLGVLEVNEGKLDAALAYFRQAAKLNPESADIHYKLGCTLAMTGDNEGARSEAALLDRLDPGLARDLRQVIEDGTGQPQAP